MFTPTISSGAIPSNIITKARREFPWAAMSTLSPASMRGLISTSKYGFTRRTVVSRLSVRGRSSLLTFLYASWSAGLRASSSSKDGGHTS